MRIINKPNQTKGTRARLGRPNMARTEGWIAKVAGPKTNVGIFLNLCPGSQIGLFAFYLAVESETHERMTRSDEMIFNGSNGVKCKLKII